MKPLDLEPLTLPPDPVTEWIDESVWRIADSIHALAELACEHAVHLYGIRRLVIYASGWSPSLYDERSRDVVWSLHVKGVGEVATVAIERDGLRFTPVLTWHGER